MSGVSGQFITFLQFVSCGTLIGILHFITHPIPARKAARILLDVFFSLLMIATVFLADLVFGKGEIKVYNAAGIALGAYIYYKILKIPLDRLSLFVYNKIINDLKGGGINEKGVD